MIDRSTCSGKLELLYQELEKRADYFGTSVADLKAYGCTITDNPNILDCVLGFKAHMTPNGQVSTHSLTMRYEAYHFIVKRSYIKAEGKIAGLITASWVKDAINYYKAHFMGTGEHMYIALFYADCYFLFDIEDLVVKLHFDDDKVISKYTKTFPCYNPQYQRKMNNTVVMLSYKWGQKYLYRLTTSEIEKIYRDHKNPVSSEQVKELEKIPVGVEAKPTNISPLI